MEALIQKRDDGVAVALVHKLLQFLTPSTCQDKWQGSLRNKVIQHWREYFDQKPDALTARDFSWAQLEPSTRCA